MKFTMKSLAIIALVVASSTVPVFAQSTAEKTGFNSLTGVAPKTIDFVQEAATSDMFEIESSKLALQKGDDATKAFAQQMITDHTKTSNDMKGFIASGKVQATLPTAMTSSQQSMLDKLKGLNGVEFNKQFISDQVSVHKDAVDLFKRYGSGGKDAELEVWAASTMPVLEHHLQMARALDK